MNKIMLAVLFCFIIMLSSCLSSASTNENPFNQIEGETLTVLFSDSRFIRDENSYYDALLELQQEHPGRIPPFIIVDKNEREKIKYYDVVEFPTMLVVSQESISLRMEGPHPKEQILKQLKEVFQ
ncbi:YbbN family protein [Bacillus solitudinis]|uniref:hypothetical protein n=1 Tax=Bacillus solitudinis TaxID=2014074 RepID=UPI000C24E553|nr:hypothetical protein [Bacillus solitudinis]